jgi:alginate O-acetyltransferase complex protein AlgI
VTVAWVFFRAATLGDAWYVVTHLLSRGGAFADRQMMHAFAACAVLIVGAVAAEYVSARPSDGLVTTRVVFRLPAPLRYAVYYVLVYGAVVAARADAPRFIYFQF